MIYGFLKNPINGNNIFSIVGPGRFGGYVEGSFILADLGVYRLKRGNKDTNRGKVDFLIKSKSQSHFGKSKLGLSVGGINLHQFGVGSWILGGVGLDYDRRRGRGSRGGDLQIEINE